MRRLLLTALTSLAWLLASPSLQLPDTAWIEVGVTPAAAQDFQGIMTDEPDRATKPVNKATKSAKKKSAKKTRSPRVGSSGVVTSNQPGFYPIQPITPPQQAPVVTGTVRTPDQVRGYPNVPTVPIVPRGATGGAGVETSQDRVIRCTHQGSLGGLSARQQGAYIQNCAF